MPISVNCSLCIQSRPNFLPASDDGGNGWNYRLVCGLREHVSAGCEQKATCPGIHFSTGGVARLLASL